MNEPMTNDSNRFPGHLALSWTCAVSPFIAVSVIVAAAVNQANEWSLGSLANDLGALMRLMSHVAWSLSVMFAAYVAGPLWLALLCMHSCRSTWKVHAMQVATFVAGWVLFWLVLVKHDLLSKID